MGDTETKLLPFIQYVNSDMSVFPKSSDTIDFRTNKKFIDDDNDFLVGDSGGFLPNMNFVFRKTHRFTEAARTYDRESKSKDTIAHVKSFKLSEYPNRNEQFYCRATRGTPKHKRYWDEETKRRKIGHTAKCKLYKKDIEAYNNAKTEEEQDALLHDIRITGSHYSYLNYSRIRRTLSDEEKIEAKNKNNLFNKFDEGFPRFWDGDYWSFKVEEFAILNAYNSVNGKARSKGYTYKESGDTSNILNLYPKTTIVYLAYEDKYLTEGDDTISIITAANLKWLETCTYWRRGMGKEAPSNIQLGYKPADSHIVTGWRSRLLSFPTRSNSSAGIGKRAFKIVCEESGNLPNLDKVVGVTLSSTEVGFGTIGRLKIFGTAGVEDANWEAFAHYFYNPDSIKAMPFENIHDYGARGTRCGYFHPQVLNLEPFMDKDGNSLLEEAYIADAEDKLFAKNSKTLAEYLVYIAQRANTPAEAFRGGTENIFSSVELDEHYSNLQKTIVNEYFKDGIIEEDHKGDPKFISHEELLFNNRLRDVHPYVDQYPFKSNQDIEGCFRMFYPPLKVDGVVPDNLYVIVMDPVKKDKRIKELTVRNSLNSFYILSLPNTKYSVRGDQIVGGYVGRHDEMSTTNRLLLNASKLYNAKVVPETSVGDIVKDFKRWGELKRIMRDPRLSIDSKMKFNNKAPYGMQMESSLVTTDAYIQLNNIFYMKMGITDDGKQIYMFNTIKDLGVIREMRSFTSSGNFDRLSALRMYPYVRSLHILKKKDKANDDYEEEEDIFTSIGLYGFKNN